MGSAILPLLLSWCVYGDHKSWEVPGKYSGKSILGGQIVILLVLIVTTPTLVVSQLVPEESWWKLAYERLLNFLYPVSPIVPDLLEQRGSILRSDKCGLHLKCQLQQFTGIQRRSPRLLLGSVWGVPWQMSDNCCGLEEECIVAILTCNYPYRLIGLILKYSIFYHRTLCFPLPFWST